VRHIAPQATDREHPVQLVAEFVGGCGFARPFHVVVVGSNGSVGVSDYTAIMARLAGD
jgi:hypothetical protein